MNKTSAVLAAVLGLLSTEGAAQDNEATPSAQPITRKPLLTALIDGGKTVERVEIAEINFSAHQKAGLHLHPCPVAGYIAEGTILFQVEGQPAKLLKAGEAFF